MAIEKVREYFKTLGIDNRIQEFEMSSATVELAAEAGHQLVFVGEKAAEEFGAQRLFGGADQGVEDFGQWLAHERHQLGILHRAAGQVHLLDGHVPHGAIRRHGIPQGAVHIEYDAINRRGWYL